MRSEDHRHRAFMFTVIGLIILLPATLLLAIITIKVKMPASCRFFCLFATLAMLSGVTALLVLHFALGPRAVWLTRGDQLLVGMTGWDDVDAGGVRSKLHTVACSSLTFHSTKLGVLVWIVTAAPNWGPRQNYSLILTSWEIPVVTRLRLAGGDLFRVQNSSGPASLAILRGERSWTEWENAGLYRLSFEKCCAWMRATPMDLNSSTVTPDRDDRYTVIVRDMLDNEPTNTSPTVLNRFNGSIDLVRKRWSPTPCDPVLCDGTRKLCRTDTTPKAYIIDYAASHETAPIYDEAMVEITCNVRHWALILLFSTVPGLGAILAVIVWRRKVKQAPITMISAYDQQPPVDPRAVREEHKNGQQNVAFEMDLV